MFKPGYLYKMNKRIWKQISNLQTSNTIASLKPNDEFLVLEVIKGESTKYKLSDRKFFVKVLFVDVVGCFYMKRSENLALIIK